MGIDEVFRKIGWMVVIALVLALFLALVIGPEDPDYPMMGIVPDENVEEKIK